MGSPILSHLLFELIARDWPTGPVVVQQDLSSIKICCSLTSEAHPIFQLLFPPGETPTQSTSGLSGCLGPFFTSPHNMDLRISCYCFD